MILSCYTGTDMAGCQAQDCSSPCCRKRWPPQGAHLRAPALSHCLLGMRWPRCSGRRTRGPGRREPEPEHTVPFCGRVQAQAGLMLFLHHGTAPDVTALRSRRIVPAKGLRRRAAAETARQPASGSSPATGTMAGPLRETDGRPPRVPRSGTRLLPRSTCSTCSRAAARTVPTAAVMVSCATGAERLKAALLLGHQPAEHFGPSNSRLI